MTINGREYAQVGNRVYTQHAVDRLQPSGLGWSGAPGGAFGVGRSISPAYVDEVLSSNLSVVKPVVGPNGESRLLFESGSLQIITEEVIRPFGAYPVDVVITVIPGG